VGIIHRRDVASSQGPQGAAGAAHRGLPARCANLHSAAERGYLDELIVPHETRSKLITALETLQTKREPGPRRKHGNIPL
jgi:propionyl-CoA carboxylase beta chain